MPRRCISLAVSRRASPSRFALLTPFAYRRRDIGTCGIDDQLSGHRHDHQIHVFHRYRTEEDFIAHHERADGALTVPEAQAKRTHIGHKQFRTICQGHLALFLRFERKLERDVQGYAQMRVHPYRQAPSL